MSNGDSSDKFKSNKTSEAEDFVKTHNSGKNDDLGYYFYPNRAPGKVVEAEKQSGLQQTVSDIMKGRHAKDHWKCRVLVEKCTQYPIVKLLMRALKSHGCPVDTDRHIQCEPCRLKVSGGFDPVLNQVVLCENSIRGEQMACNIMAHELLHAFDKCRTTMDFKNAEHVACTEIRAANLFHCSFTSAVATGEAYPFAMKDKHQDCVKRKAMISLLLVRNISDEEAKETVERVFNRCYNDLEPVGRRIRKVTKDCERALSDGVMFGYTET